MCFASSANAELLLSQVKDSPQGKVGHQVRRDLWYPNRSPAPNTVGFDGEEPQTNLWQSLGTAPVPELCPSPGLRGAVTIPQPQPDGFYLGWQATDEILTGELFPAPAASGT